MMRFGQVNKHHAVLLLSQISDQSHQAALSIITMHKALVDG